MLLCVKITKLNVLYFLQSQYYRIYKLSIHDRCLNCFIWLFDFLRSMNIDHCRLAVNKLVGRVTKSQDLISFSYTWLHISYTSWWANKMACNFFLWVSCAIVSSEERLSYRSSVSVAFQYLLFISHDFPKVVCINCGLFIWRHIILVPNLDPIEHCELCV